MKKSKTITTFLICLSLVLNFASLNSSSAYLEQLANIEFESEIESEAEKNNKSKLDYLGEAFKINFSFKSFLSFNFSTKSLFCQDFICEVPTSPPNNC